MESIFDAFFQATDLVVDYFKLSVCHGTTCTTIRSSIGGIVIRTCVWGTIKSDIPLHVLEWDLFLQTDLEIGPGQLVFHSVLIIWDTDFWLDISGYFSHCALDIKKISLAWQLIAHFLLVGFRWQYLLHLFNALTLRLHDVTCCFERKLHYFAYISPLALSLKKLNTIGKNTASKWLCLLLTSMSSYRISGEPGSCSMP